MVQLHIEISLKKVFYLSEIVTNIDMNIIEIG